MILRQAGLSLGEVTGQSPRNPADQAELLTVIPECVQLRSVPAGKWERECRRGEEMGNLDRGHWKCLWGEEEGRLRAQEQIWKGCPGGQTKGKPGKVQAQKGAREQPRREERNGSLGQNQSWVMREWELQL